MTATIQKLITAEELRAMGDIGRCELIFGELVMISPAGVGHGVVALRLGRFLGEFVDRHELGLVLAAETGYRIQRDPDLVRAPDASFVRKDRLPKTLPRGFFEGVPDLAVEVVSPDDTRREVAEKTNMWLAHGTQAVWVADPKDQTLKIHRVGRPILSLGLDGEIRDEPLLPGFNLALSKVFKLP